MDPLGFIDGSSLYRAYLPTGSNDPLGTSINLVFDPASHVGAPWANHPLPPGQPGETVKEFICTCDCESCQYGCPWERVFECTLVVKQFIFIDYSQLGTFTDPTGAVVNLDGVYGHEQLHVKNRIDDVNRVWPDVLKRFIGVIPTECEPPEDCVNTARILARDIRGELIDQLFTLLILTGGPHGDWPTHVNHTDHRKMVLCTLVMEVSQLCLRFRRGQIHIITSLTPLYRWQLQMFKFWFCVHVLALFLSGQKPLLGIAQDKPIWTTDSITQIEFIDSGSCLYLTNSSVGRLNIDDNNIEWEHRIVGENLQMTWNIDNVVVFDVNSKATIFDTTSGKIKHELSPIDLKRIASGKRISAILALPNNELLIAATDRTKSGFAGQVYNLKEKSLTRSVFTERALLQVRLSSCGKMILATTLDGRLSVRDSVSNNPMFLSKDYHSQKQEIMADEGVYFHLPFYEEKTKSLVYVKTGGWKGSAVIVEDIRNETSRMFKLSEACRFLDVDFNNRRFVVVGDSGVIQLFRFNGDSIEFENGEVEKPNCAVFSPNGKRLLVVGKNSYELTSLVSPESNNK
jgi:hypothetical protein